MTNSDKPDVADKGLALVVDDVDSNRKILEALLKKEGYQTISAADGAQAVQLYIDLQPDIVFMDAMMPVMDGYEATARIKALAGNHFVPVIFITALNENEALVKCVDAGGDDFLCKPYSREILGAKIKAMERIRNLSRSVAVLHQKLERHHQILLNEQIIAEQIYHRAITEGNIATEYIRLYSRPISVFSGDMVISAYHPDGSVYILLGDFTGHGLIAALGMLPAVEVFRAMTAKGFSAPQILSAMNGKLHRLLPTGMFMTACFVTIDKDLSGVCIWNAGMPDALILDNLSSEAGNTTVKHRAGSQYLSLGILKDADFEPAPVCLNIKPGDRLLLCSDGLSEAINSSGEAFGFPRYERAATAKQDSFKSIVGKLEEFCGEQPYNDDVTFVEINCSPGLLQVAEY